MLSSSAPIAVQLTSAGQARQLTRSLDVWYGRARTRYRAAPRARRAQLAHSSALSPARMLAQGWSVRHACPIRWHLSPSVSPWLAPTATMDAGPLEQAPGRCAALAPVHAVSAAAARRPAALNSSDDFLGASMKKARYIIGTVGVLGAAPALGVLMPTTSAAAAPRAAAGAHGGKTVSVQHITLGHPIAASPYAERCQTKSRRKAQSGTGVDTFSGFASGEAFGGDPCLRAVTGKLHHSQVGLEMRVRTYKGTTERSWGYVHGTINITGTSTYFSKVIDGIAGSDTTEACEALVYSASHVVAYGPICEGL
jgi:hypothetical protein